jgi:hypothetical protein
MAHIRAQGLVLIYSWYALNHPFPLRVSEQHLSIVVAPSAIGLDKSGGMWESRLSRCKKPYSEKATSQVVDFLVSQISIQYSLHLFVRPLSPYRAAA